MYSDPPLLYLIFAKQLVNLIVKQRKIFYSDFVRDVARLLLFNKR